MIDKTSSRRLMQRFVLRLLLAAPLLTAPAGVLGQASGGSPPAAAPGADPDAEGVLTQRGLKRVGNLYLLDTEVQVRPQLQQWTTSLQRLRAEGAALQRDLSQIQAQLPRQAQRQQYFQNLLEQTENNIQSIDPQNVQLLNQAQSQARQIRDQLFQTNSNVVTLQANLQRGNERIATVTSQIGELETQIQGQLDGLVAQYQSIAADPAIVEALLAINRRGRPWVTIGPELDAPRKLAQLAERVLNAAGFRLNPKRTMIACVPEETFNEQAHAAWTYQSKLSGLEGAQNRQKLEELVPKLRPLAEAARRTIESAQKDPGLAAAVAEYNAATGLKLRYTPTRDFTRNVDRIPEFEKAVGYKPQLDTPAP